MRDILFRGKSLRDGNLVYGDFRNTNGMSPYNAFIVTHTNEQYNEVDPNTVEQFTGLFDKNGKKIFEGDIVLYRNESVGVVGFADGAFGVRFGDGTSAMFLCFAAEHSVVIGNIYDDQELCKVYNLFIMCS